MRALRAKLVPELGRTFPLILLFHALLFDLI